MAHRLLLLVALASQAAAVALPDCAEVGKAYTDPNVTTENGGLRDSAAECQQACVGQPNCTKMTWFNDSKACWLLTSSAALRTVQTPADLTYAVSADKICEQAIVKETKISQQSNWATPPASSTNTGSNTTNASVLTDGATATNKEFSAEATAKDAAKEEYYGMKWQYIVLGGLATCVVCSLVACCFMMSGGKSSKKTGSRNRGIKVDDEESGMSVSRAEEVTPLVSPPAVDAGLQMPQLLVPEIQPARLVQPQLVTVPASTAMAAAAAPTANLFQQLDPAAGYQQVQQAGYLQAAAPSPYYQQAMYR